MKKVKVAFVVAWIIWIAVLYYTLLPAINIHSSGCWMFIIFAGLIPIGLLMMISQILSKVNSPITGISIEIGKNTKRVFILAGILLVAYIVINLFSATIFHASAYASIMQTEESDFTQDITQADAVTQIALMDTDSAILLGNREIGSLSEVVSQYNVSSDYTQIDLNGSPVKVSALDYAGFFKYVGNHKNGIPGYVKVDPVGQNAEYIALEEGMKYVPSSYFGKDITRHLRFKYPTKVFGNVHFEVDEDGEPYYVASVYDYKVGLFGGTTVQGAIVCDAVTGDCEYYEVAEVPTWVDDVFEGDLLVQQYDWNGTLSGGFWNSKISKKGCKKCTETLSQSIDSEGNYDYAPDYGYVAKDGDIWIYTGVTSVNDDASNIGFLLVNERTSEAHFYTIAGADENSAMAAAEGEVQEKNYVASFPSLINVDDQPTYIMVLKDASGIVKLYAMVNVESYNIVTTASTMDECFAKYRTLIGTAEEIIEDEPEDEEEDSKDEPAEDKPIITMQFTVTGIQYIDIDGNTYVYLTGNDGNIYKQKFIDNEQLIYVTVGNQISAQCSEDGDGIYTMVETQVEEPTIDGV